MCELYERVERARLVAPEFGISDQTVYRVLEKHGIQRTHRHPKPTPKPRRLIDGKRVVELFEQGMTQTAIAKILGCSDRTVHYHLKKAGLTKERHKVSDDEILELHRQGNSGYRIADKLGIGRDKVMYCLHKNGIRTGRGHSASRTVTCPRCRNQFNTSTHNQTYCSTTCANAVNWSVRRDRKRANGNGERILLHDVWKRDKGRCYICGRKTDWNDHKLVDGNFISGPLYPTREHVIALNNGGTHTWDNIRLACFECNSKKSDRGQMRLAI